MAAERRAATCHPRRHDRRAAPSSIALVAIRVSRTPVARSPRRLSPRRPTARRPTARRSDFPSGFGAHPDTRIEWWYVTGALEAAARVWGFQITFFRAATGIAAASSSRFAARELVFAHAAVSDLEQHRLRHDQRIARSGFGIAEASPRHETRSSRARLDARAATAASMAAAATAARAASDEAARSPSISRSPRRSRSCSRAPGGVVAARGRAARRSSRYYSEPQLDGHGRRSRSTAAAVAVTGRAWLDHEWSDSFLDREAVGWDWIGMNLDDGAALTAFRLRRADGSTLWSGGSFRRGRTARRATSPTREVVLGAGPDVDEPGDRARAIRSSGPSRRPRVASPCARCSGRPGARQPREHRLDLLGRPVAACSMRAAPARRPRLPRDDGLRRSASCCESIARGTSDDVAQCARARVDAATFFAGLVSPDEHEQAPRRAGQR